MWREPTRRTDLVVFNQMIDRLAHRGPDGRGCWDQPGVSLGHRRLSIIDLVGGAQPLANETETVWVVFNGEIYNFRELGPQLEQGGHRFRTHCDTEVLVHLWEEYGPAMVDYLRGMFAFALFDTRDRTLFLARDRMGQKPLLYRLDETGLRFASELKALTVEPDFPRLVDELALQEYLNYQYVPAPRTIWQACQKLPPAHWALYRDGKLQVQRYWQPSFQLVDRPLADWQDQLRAELTTATRLRMISDVPIGAFLSGGLDSTIIVGLMQKLADRPVQTFSIGFPIPEFDESAFAQLAANHLGTEHHNFSVDADAVQLLPKIAYFYDEPFADSSAIPTYYVSQYTRQRVTVALTGDAGDELFVGYPRYQAVQIGERFARLPAWLRWPATWSLWQQLPVPGRQKSTLRRFQKLLRVLAEPVPKQYRAWISIFDDLARQTLFTPDFQAHLQSSQPEEWIERWYRHLPERDPVTQATYVDLNTYLPGDLLVKVDIASMAHGLECRSPFLDHHVVELASQMPVSLKLHGKVTKWILRQTFADLLPPVVQRRGKMGFGVPIDHWFRKELKPMLLDYLNSTTFRHRGWFRPAAVEQLIAEHQSGRWDHSYRLWALLILELWCRQYLDVCL